MRTHRIRPPVEASKFTVENIEGTAELISSGKLPLHRTSIGDDVVTGLRASFHPSSLITYVVMYTVGDKRSSITIGVHDPDHKKNKNPDHLSIAEARELAKTIKAIADKGIDPQEGLHRRLIKELKRDGVKHAYPVITHDR